jgi:phenylalanyl-tRNA synthetase beta chain
VAALARACQLLEQIGAGTVRPGWIDAYPGRREARSIAITAARVARVIGKTIEPERIERMLTSLGFACRRTTAGGNGVAWDVTVPSWRGDVAGDMDLVEEVARHDGYENLPTTFPALTQPTARPDPRLRRDGIARRLALGMGFSECVTFAFVERTAAAAFADESELVAIANPLSETFAVLRPVVLTGVLDSLAHNRRRERRDVQLFETGSRFTRSRGEFRGIALGWTGAAAPEHWSGSGRAVDFFDMKGAVEGLLAGLGLESVFTAAGAAWLVSGRAAAVAVKTREGERTIGACGQLVAAIAAARGVPPQDEVYVAELDLDAIADLVDFGESVRYAPLPRFPSIVRDLSLVVGERVRAADLRRSIRAAAPATLADVQEFARYQGKSVPEGAMSLSFRLTFRAADRTLTDAEVQAAVDAIVGVLAERHGARLR